MKLKDLKNALAPILQLCDKKMSFEVEGISFTIRLLTEEEEREVFDYAQNVVAEADYENLASGKEPQGKAVGWYDCWRRGTLSHSICKIGEHDFTLEPFIFDEELNAKVPKHDALKDILTGFTRPLLEKLHIKYGELLDEAELDAENAIVINEVRTEELIKVYSEKVESLKKNLENQRNREDKTRNQILESSRIVSNYVRQENLDALPPNETVRPQILPTNSRTRPVRETTLIEETLEDVDELEDVEPHYEEPESVTIRPERIPVYPTQGNPPPPPRNNSVPNAQETFLEDSSFFEGEDIEIAAQRENQRLAQLRAQRKQATVPHARAALAQKEIMNTKYNPVGEKDSVPVFAAEKYVHTLPPTKNSNVTNNPPASNSPHSNPNFNPHRKG